MAELICSSVTKIKNCDCTIYETDITSLADDMVAHIKSHHPLWYDRLTFQQRNMLQFRMIGMFEHALQFR